MKRASFRKTALAMVVGATALAAATVTAGANAFFGWQVTNVPSWDVLNVRGGPNTSFPILVAYPNGTPLSMTGPCTKSLHLSQISGLPAWQQTQAVRYRWCEVWVDPIGNGNFQPGWVYGKYIKPM